MKKQEIIRKIMRFKGKKKDLLKLYLDLMNLTK
jgi:hypothetical protein